MTVVGSIENQLSCPVEPRLEVDLSWLGCVPRQSFIEMSCPEVLKGAQVSLHASIF